MLYGFGFNDQPRVEEKPADIPDDIPHGSCLTLSMLISESVYRLICLVERSYRWFRKVFLRPYLFLLRLLLG